MYDRRGHCCPIGARACTPDQCRLCALRLSQADKCRDCLRKARLQCLLLRCCPPHVDGSTGVDAVSISAPVKPSLARCRFTCAKLSLILERTTTNFSLTTSGEGFEPSLVIVESRLFIFLLTSVCTTIRWPIGAVVWEKVSTLS